MSSEKNTHLSTAYLHEYSRVFKVISILIVFCFLYSCSSSPSRAPISTRGQPPSTMVVEHVVSPGETLYSIAWRYGLDYKGLARVNGIGLDYGIFPSQIIRLEGEPSVALAPIPVVAAASPAPPKVFVRPAPKSMPVEKTSQPTVNPTPVIKQPVEASRPEKKSTPVVNSADFISTRGKIYWRWPAKGKVITNFYNNKGVKKGIDIEGKKGESVTAAASGKVVYAGGGLRAYGKLVIIKHSEVYLSAYAHNHRLRVKEGDVVSTGQRIADIGSTGVGVKGKPRLHFQIRRNGKPINPLPLLPKRK
ncbi:MAG: lipoprotein NlpD [Cellvibrionaceae bacterium]|jgi:lipoprotein NlpD